MKRVCEICKTKFYGKPNHVARGWARYCSKSCQNVGQRSGVSTHCFLCKKEVYRSKQQAAHSASGHHFCSKSCQARWRNAFYAGERHANWKGGETAYRRIMQRANIPMKCEHCKTKDERVIIVHHKDRNRNNNQLSNLMYLCMNCHFIEHRYTV